MRSSTTSAVLYITIASSVLLLTPTRTPAQDFPGDQNPEHVRIYIVDGYDHGIFIGSTYYGSEASANNSRLALISKYPNFKFELPVERSVEEERKRIKLWYQQIQQNVKNTAATATKIAGLKNKLEVQKENLGPGAEKIMDVIDKLDKQLDEVNSWVYKKYDGPIFLKQGSWFYYDKEGNEYTKTYRDTVLSKIKQDIAAVATKGQDFLRRARAANQISKDLTSIERDVDRSRDRNNHADKNHKRTAESFDEIVKASKSNNSNP